MENKKIKLIFDQNYKSFSGLFKNCSCIKKINIIKFYRNDIYNISEMFSGCLSSEEINFYGFESHKTTDMKKLFFMCTSLNNKLYIFRF